jgi:hypothetical protein
VPSSHTWERGMVAFWGNGRGYFYCWKNSEFISTLEARRQRPHCAGVQRGGAGEGVSDTKGRIILAQVSWGT